MGGFSGTTNGEDVVFAKNVDFTGAADRSDTMVTDGQLLIASTALNGGGTHINVGTITSPLGTIDISYDSPDITIDLAGGGTGIDSIGMQSGTDPVTPDGTGLIEFVGQTALAGTTPVETEGLAPNIMALNVQLSQAIASADVTKVGLCNFDSASFDVDADGFVSLTGGGIAIDSIGMQSGTDPVTGDGSGLIEFVGQTALAGTTPVQTEGLAANIMALNVQLSQAIAAPDVTKVGLAVFDDAYFSVDATGFVSVSTPFEAVFAIEGDDTVDVVPDGSGVLFLEGNTVANSTNAQAVFTHIGGDANTEVIDVQVAADIVASDITKVGLAAFDSADFSVDADGFVSLTGSVSPSTQSIVFEDFIFSSVGPGAQEGDFRLNYGATFTHTNETNHPGILVYTQSGSGNTSKLVSNDNDFNEGIQFGMYTVNFEFMSRVDVLGSADPDYQVFFGFWQNTDTDPETGNSDGLYFKYYYSNNAGKWQIISRASGVTTTENTNSTVDTNFHKFNIIVNSAGTSASFYIDDVEVTNSPIVTNIPVSRQNFAHAVHRVAGNAARGYSTDYWDAKFNFTR